MFFRTQLNGAYPPLGVLAWDRSNPPSEIRIHWPPAAPRARDPGFSRVGSPRSQLDRHATLIKQTDGDGVGLEARSARHVLDAHRYSFIRHGLVQPDVFGDIPIASAVYESVRRSDDPGRWVDEEPGRGGCRPPESEGLEILYVACLRSAVHGETDLSAFFVGRLAWWRPRRRRRPFQRRRRRGPNAAPSSAVRVLTVGPRNERTLLTHIHRTIGQGGTGSAPSTDRIDTPREWVQENGNPRTHGDIHHRRRRGTYRSGWRRGDPMHQTRRRAHR